MSGRNIGIVFRKELTDTLRDRRTLISSILLPLLLFPLLTVGFAGLAIVLARRATAEAFPVMLTGKEHAPELWRRIARIENFKMVPPSADYVRQINDKTLRAAVEFPPDFEKKLLAGVEEAQIVKVYHFQGELRSVAALRKIEKAVREYQEEIVKQRLDQRGVAQKALTPFEFEKQNVASAEKVGGNIAGFLLPYFIIVLCLTGAMYPAMDLTAGEKERGTLETLLASAASRMELVFGKFLLVLAMSLVTTLLSMISLVLTILLGAGLIRRVSSGFVIALSVKSLAAAFFLILPLAVIFSAVLLAISLFARNYREAQSYVGPLIFVVILPALVSFVPGMELNPRLALVPILNVSLAAKEVFSGNYPWKALGIILGSTSLYAVAALWWAVRQFHREKVLFRT